jgi:hypothetical protein
VGQIRWSDEAIERSYGICRRTLATMAQPVDGEGAILPQTLLTPREQSFVIVSIFAHSSDVEGRFQ